MYILFLLLHLIIAFLLGVVVLLQRSKGNGLAGAFGGAGAGEAVFGAQGVTTFLHKATIWLAVAFMASSMGLAILSAGRSGSDGSSIGRRVQESLPVSSSAPAVPVTTGVDGVDSDGAPVPIGDDSGVVPEGIVPEGDATAGENGGEGGTDDDPKNTGGEGTSGDQGGN